MFDLSPFVWWCLIAAFLVALELASGTFYLLMLSAGAVAGAICAWLGGSGPAQAFWAAVVGIGSVAAWHAYRVKHVPPAQEDMNLDAGQSVQVTHWNEDGTTQVQYRGAAWTASYAGSDQPQAGAHQIQSVQGTRLVLTRQKN
ncbi:MAG: NfeD family protein [Aquabacterium sp.]